MVEGNGEGWLTGGGDRPMIGSSGIGTSSRI